MKYTKNDNIYPMRANTLKRLSKLRGKLICASGNCDKPIKVGQLVISRICNKHRRKVYHKRCYDKSFMEL